MIHEAKVFKTWHLLKITYAIVPILVGLDKIFMSNMIVDWAKYVSPVISSHIPLDIAHFLMIVGIIEVLAGILVWFAPRFGGYLVALWMLAIVLNLISMNAFYDIIARDIVIAIGALALAWLSEAIKA